VFARDGATEVNRQLECFGDTLAGALGGECSVAVRVTSGDAQGIMLLGDEWKVHASGALIEQLERRFGVVRVAYGAAGSTSSVVSA